MEHYPNETIYYKVTEDSNYAGPQQFNTVSYYGTELARGLAYLAKEGIVHRDMKLENCSLDVEGHARIIDFGMAKHGMNKKNTNSFVGTPCYSSS